MEQATPRAALSTVAAQRRSLAIGEKSSADFATAADRAAEVEFRVPRGGITRPRFRDSALPPSNRKGNLLRDADAVELESLISRRVVTSKFANSNNHLVHS